MLLLPQPNQSGANSGLFFQMIGNPWFRDEQPLQFGLTLNSVPIGEIDHLAARGEEPWLWAWEAAVDSRSGRVAEASRALAKLEHVAGSRPDRYPTLLLAYSGTGGKERVLKLLESAYADHSNAIVQIKVDPIYDPIRSDPRFGDLLRRVRLDGQEPSGTCWPKPGPRTRSKTACHRAGTAPLRECPDR